ncbi:MAG: universal stress protein [Mycobacterium sp.]
MSTYGDTGRGILVGVDGSPPSKVAVDWAAREAAMRNVPLTLVHVVAPSLLIWSDASVPAGFLSWQQEQADEIIRQATQVARDAGVTAAATGVLDGPIAPTMVDLSKDAQLVVVGCRGLGAVGRALLGSVSTALVHHAHCPVAIVRDEDAPAPRPATAPVVVGVDGSPASERAVAIAFDEASWRGVNLVAVHAFGDVWMLDYPGSEFTAMRGEAAEVLAERLAGWQERYPDVEVHKVVVADRPAHRLLELAETAQLVVVGNRGRGGVGGMLLGSVSTAVVHSVKVPVIVARGS